MPVLSANELAYLVHAAGFDRTGTRRHRGQREDTTAVAIALCESGGNTDAKGDQGQSWGLFQIYQPVWGDTFPAGYDFFDAGANTRAAYFIFERAGRKFGDWSCFNNGGYVRHLAKASRAVKDPQKPSGSSGRVEGIAEPGMAAEGIGLPNPLGFLSPLFQEATWTRVAMFIGGLVLLVVVFVMMFGDDIAKVTPVGKVAKGAKRVGKVGKAVKRVTS